MRKKRDVKEIMGEIAKPVFSMSIKSNGKGAAVACEGRSTDLLFGLHLLIESLIKEEVATEKEIRQVVDLTFMDDDERAEELLSKLKQVNKHLENMIKEL